MAAERDGSGDFPTSVLLPCVPSAAMAISGGLALQSARPDLFELLSDGSAQEIAALVYAAMAAQHQEDVSREQGS